MIGQQAAQARREEKVRQEKEKLMAEEDPEKQRRMEVSVLLLGIVERLLLITLKIYGI